MARLLALILTFICWETYSDQSEFVFPYSSDRRITLYSLKSRILSDKNKANFKIIDKNTCVEDDHLKENCKIIIISPSNNTNLKYIEKYLAQKENFQEKTKPKGKSSLLLGLGPHVKTVKGSFRNEDFVYESNIFVAINTSFIKSITETFGFYLSGSYINLNSKQVDDDYRVGLGTFFNIVHNEGVSSFDLSAIREISNFRLIQDLEPIKARVSSWDYAALYKYSYPLSDVLNLHFSLTYRSSLSNDFITAIESQRISSLSGYSVRFGLDYKNLELSLELSQRESTGALIIKEERTLILASSRF